ncbi:hypothetical protein Taro_002712 [Colocasia esculenta]|uniref:Plus3 domain-containing protein n=1 Tax=Colocasia esculenta TaxID=4460 RepID=A0A843TLN8_COLES|nr:hypothetical protein [Colocasia esculenta]
MAGHHCRFSVAPLVITVGHRLCLGCHCAPLVRMVPVGSHGATWVNTSRIGSISSSGIGFGSKGIIVWCLVFQEMQALVLLPQALRVCKPGAPVRDLIRRPMTYLESSWAHVLGLRQLPRWIRPGIWVTKRWARIWEPTMMDSTVGAAVRQGARHFGLLISWGLAEIENLARIRELVVRGSWKNGNIRKPSGSQVPLKKRLDPLEKDIRGGRGDDYDDDDDEDDHDDEHSGNDSDSAPSVGSDLYIDEEDRKNLENMTELDREMILTERSIKRDDYQLKKKARASSSKNDALNELRAKRMKQHDSDVYRRLRDSAGGGDGAVARIRGRRDGIAAENELADSDEDGSTSDTEPGTFEDIKEITIRRSKLAKWFMEPFFEELIVGCFVRVGIGRTRIGQSIYRLCLVRNVDASEPDRLYNFENKTTYKYLNCVWGAESSAARWQMAMISDSGPSMEEFKALIKEVEQSSGRMPSRQDVHEKRDSIQKINNYIYSAATVKQMLQEKKSVSSRPMNVAAEKDRLRKAMEVAESRGDEAEIERVKERLKELQEMSRRSKEKDAKAVRLAEMNKKNREENFKNASELKPVNTSLKAGEAGYDPFSRRWTQSRNYYVSKTGGAEDEATGNRASSNASNGKGVGQVQDGEAATAVALEAAADAGKLVDTFAPTDQGTESNLLHNFELPISLSALQKFGGPQGAQMGFMARKQKIEATMGYKVPENDGRRHPLTLTFLRRAVHLEGSQWRLGGRSVEMDLAIAKVMVDAAAGRRMPSDDLLRETPVLRLLAPVTDGAEPPLTLWP